MSATYMPAVLDWVFDAVERANFIVPNELEDTDGVPSNQPQGEEGEGAEVDSDIAETAQGGRNLIQLPSPSDSP